MRATLAGLALLAVLPGCAATVGAAVGTAVTTTASAVGGAVSLTGRAVGGAARLAIPGGGDEDDG